MRTKLAFSFVLVTAALLCLIVVIVRIIYFDGDDYSKAVMNQQNYSSTVLPFKRGEITDRNQTVLAASEQVYNLILDFSVLSQRTEESVDATFTALTEVFGLDRSSLEKMLADDPENPYVRELRYLSEDEKETFEAYEDEYNDSVGSSTLQISGVWFESEFQRVYPYESLACSALGFSGSDSSLGNWGIEQYYNDYLVGTDGREYGYMDSDGIVERTTREAVDGDTIVTTLDYTIQRVVENAIAEYCEDVDVDNLGVLVMDPNTAEILAMATDSVYDLNNPTDLSGIYTEEELTLMSDEEKSDALNSLWRNFTISDTFEPGSTAKTFTVAAALEEAIAAPGDMFSCDGGQQVADWYVKCSHTHGTLSLEQALGYSCNDTMMQLASKLGKTIFSSYQARFGLGSVTGVDLPGEASGILYSEEEMGSVDLATNSFGQNFTATMIQMAAAYCSILNGGSYYQPHIVKQILTADGTLVKEVGSEVVRQTVSASTVATLKEGLQMAVEDPSGTATAAQIDGYTVGGKTGTAEKYPRGNDEYVLSFLGFTTIENPQVIVYVVIDNPHDDRGTVYTSKEAVSLEQEIMSAILDYMNISRDVPSAEESEEISPETEETDAGETAEDGGEAGAPEAEEEEEDAGAADTGESRDGPWEDEVPEGGFMDEDPGPPDAGDAEEEEEEEADDDGSGEEQEEDADTDEAG